MDVKFGKIKPSNNFFNDLSVSDSDENFFTSLPNVKKHESHTSGNRINDYDSNILENNAYQALSDEIFKIEHKMNTMEESLSKINNEIATLEGLGYDIQINELKNRKQKIEQELAELNKKYSSLGLGSKISGQISSAVNLASNKFGSIEKNNVFSKVKDFLSKKVLAKLSKKIDYTQTMKEALDNLSNINLSVDELIKMQVPYGENLNRYEKLTAYLNKANIIHSQISKNINTTSIKKA